MTPMNRDPILIALAGRAGTGKDTAADHLCREYGFVRFAFADTIKTMCEALMVETGADYAHLYEPRLKGQVIPELGVSARELMQRVGDMGRAIRPAFWVDMLARQLGLQAGGSPVHDRIVITDVRFPEEAAWVTAAGGRVIRLHRDSAAPVRAHDSEDHVDSLHAHVDLFNHGPTLEGLHTLLDGTMADLQVQRRGGLE